MIRISLSYIYNLAAALDPIGQLSEEQLTKSSIFLRCLMAQNVVTEMIINTLYAPHSKASYQPAQKLLSELSKVTVPPLDGAVTDYELFLIKQAFTEYKTVLLADLAILHCYFVTQKGALDNWSLLMNGENLFPDDLSSKVPEAIFDAREAGKCLAYENSTAAGFHIFRVLECVLRRYYSQVTGGETQPKVRNIAVYVNAMQQAKKGDEKILFLVKQISDRFRNPLVHPDSVLDIDTAIEVHGLVRSAVTSMLRPLIPPALTTSTAVIAAEPG